MMLWVPLGSRTTGLRLAWPGEPSNWHKAWQVTENAWNRKEKELVIISGACICGLGYSKHGGLRDSALGFVEKMELEFQCKQTFLFFF